MKKSNYITKYDYINRYTKQPAMWFYKNNEILANYNLQLKKCTNNKHDSIVEIEDEELDEEDIEFDSYSFYREFLEENAKLDENDALLISGRIIDQESKKHIIDFHKKKYSCDFIVVDFDTKKGNLIQNFIETKQLIDNNDNVILFQPVFIDEQKKILTKCDAVVKYQNEIYLIETKATSTAKFVHILDLFFQKKIIETILPTSKYDHNYQLCLIRYEYLKANEVSFIISDTINLRKAVAVGSKKMNLENKQLLKIGATYEYHTAKEDTYKEIIGLDINSALDLDHEFAEYCQNQPKNVKTDIFGIMTQLIHDFDKTIDELWAFKKDLEIKTQQGEQSNDYSFLEDFLPNKLDKSVFKNTDMWLELKYLYLQKGMNFFKYSGNVLSQSEDNLEQIREAFLKGINVNLEELIRSKNEGKEVYANLFFHSNNDFLIDSKNYHEYMSKLKNNHVYFDFETINPAIRVVDKSLPFAQVVTQCSILKKHGDQYEDDCINLMVDPMNVTLNFFKEIVDKLYEGSNYSYIVYNKTFEKKRLEEFKDYLDDVEYSKKIDIIIDNLFDLADFFKVSASGHTIFVKELGGFYSIKKVLPLVEKYEKDIFEQTKCLDYHDLNISNGLQCQTKSLQRFFKIIQDEHEWNQIVEDSKKYCENDVRAMVAVLFFIKKLYQKYTN